MSDLFFRVTGIVAALDEDLAPDDLDLVVRVLNGKRRIPVQWRFNPTFDGVLGHVVRRSAVQHVGHVVADLDIYARHRPLFEAGVGAGIGGRTTFGRLIDVHAIGVTTLDCAVYGPLHFVGDDGAIVLPPTLVADQQHLVPLGEVLGRIPE